MPRRAGFDHGVLLGEHNILGKADSLLGKEIHAVPSVDGRGRSAVGFVVVAPP